MHSQTGLSLIEVLISILLLSFTLFTLFADLAVQQKLVANLLPEI